MQSTRPRIVIPGDCPPQLQGSPHLLRLQQHAEVTLFPDLPANDEEKVSRARGALCLINSRSGLKWPGFILRQLPGLRMISTCGIGTDAIDLETARELGIVVSNIPARTASIVAEHALALMLAVAKRAWFQTNAIKSGRWIGRNNVYLRGKTLGLLGAGNIAMKMAELAKGIGMQVQAWTFHPTEERSERIGIPFLPLDDILQTSDVISIHLRLTDQSRGLLGDREFSLMKPGALLVNTARGAIVDRDSLVRALRSGRLEGAGIDVFEQEPIPADDPLLQCEQVVLTPHNADQTPEGMEILNEGAVDNVIAFLEGRPRHVVV